jgi:hypothetical protein
MISPGGVSGGGRSAESGAFDIAFEMPPPTPPSTPLPSLDDAGEVVLDEHAAAVEHVEAGEIEQLEEVEQAEAIEEVEEFEEPAVAVEDEVVETVPANDRGGDEGLLDDLLDKLDDNFLAIESKKAAPVSTTAEIAPPPVEVEEEFGDGALQDIFEEFKSTFEQDTSQDFDTHYNLGIAYRDMELLDDAIEEFQAAIRTTSPTAPDGRYIQCCNMLGLSTVPRTSIRRCDSISVSRSNVWATLQRPSTSSRKCTRLISTIGTLARSCASCSRRRTRSLPCGSPRQSSRSFCSSWSALRSAFCWSFCRGIARGRRTTFSTTSPKSSALRGCSRLSGAATCAAP